MSDPFWDIITSVLDGATRARTADQLISAVECGPSQDSKDPGAQALFAGSGGDRQLSDALEEGGGWDIRYVEGDYGRRAAAKCDGSVVEYIEGDLYRRDA